MSADKAYQEKGPSYVALIVLLWCLTAGVYFIGLNSYPLLDPDEGRYAEIPREMIEAGDFITPRLNYVPYFEKPPLFYWCTAGAMMLLGQNEWAVRTVPALAGLLTVILITAFGNRLFGRDVGLMAGWVYLTSVVPLILARLPIIDGLFSLLLTATWMAWWFGYRAPPGPVKNRWMMAAWAFLGLAVLTKGPAAVALTGLIVFMLVAARRDWGGLRSMCWIRGLLIFALIVLPWHLAAGARNPEFFHFYFVVQHFGRMVQEEHSRPFWYFLAVFPFGMLFWSAFFFPALLQGLGRAWRAVRLPCRPQQSRNHSEDVPDSSCRAHDAGHYTAILFLVIWAGAVVGLFSLSRCKLVPYILPAYPAMALLTAAYLREGPLSKAPRWCAGITAVFLMAAIPVVSYYARSQDMLPISELEWPVILAQCALLAGSVLLGLSVFRQALIPFATGLVMVFLIPSMLMVVPVAASYRKVGGLVKGMALPLPQGIRVAEWRTFDQGLGFYTQRRTILVDNVGELRFGQALGDHEDYFLKGEESLKRLGRQGPVLLNIRPDDWPTVRQWGLFHLVAANSTNVMVGNDAFFRLTGLTPWPADTVVSPPLLLRPRPVTRGKSG